MEQRKMYTYLLYVDENGQQYREYLCEPGDEVRLADRYIGGVIGVRRVSEGVEIVYDEDAIVFGKPLNRALYDATDRLVTVFAGNIMVKGIEEKAKECVARLRPIERIYAGKVYEREEVLDIFDKKF